MGAVFGGFHFWLRPFQQNGTDLAAFGGVFLLPFLLGGAMGTWAVLVGQLSAVLPVVYSIKTSRISLSLPWKSRRIFCWEI
jgi:hypothetical protein